MVKTWRIVKARHAPSGFDGEGARLFGSRWTSPGIRAVFTSETLSLATLEILVHLQSSPVLASYVAFPVELPEAIIQELDRRLLPEDWRAYPASRNARAIGDAWVESGSSAVLKVPSVIIEHEHNFVLNPSHPDFSTITIGALQPLNIDPRLLPRSNASG